MIHTHLSKTLVKWLGAIACMLSGLLQSIDTTIANVALPYMQGNLGVNQDEISWVLTSYILSSAIFMTLTGIGENIFGREKLLLIAITGFTLASMACGASPSFDFLVFSRIAQGIFGAFLVPLSQTFILDIFPKEQRGTAFSIWGLGIMVGPILGPILGGYLTEYYSWRWVFYINFPIGLLAFVMSYLFLTNSGQSKDPINIDWFGFSTLSIAITCLQLILDRGQILDWFSNIQIKIYFLIMCISVSLFLIHTFTSIKSFIPLSMFKDRNFTVGLFMAFILGLNMQSFAIIPQFLEDVLQYPPLVTGIISAPRGVGGIAGLGIAALLMRFITMPSVMVIGFLCSYIGFEAMSRFALDVSPFSIGWTGIMLGIGLSMLFTPLSTITFTTLEDKYRPQATGLYNLVRNIGNSIGISLGTVFITRYSQTNHQILGGWVTERNIVKVSSVFEQSPEVLLPVINKIVEQQSTFIAYLNDFYFMALASILSIPFLILFSSHSPSGGKQNIIIGE